jgi:hypothetical protein
MFLKVLRFVQPKGYQLESIFLAKPLFELIGENKLCGLAGFHNI